MKKTIFRILSWLSILFFLVLISLNLYLQDNSLLPLIIFIDLSIIILHIVLEIIG